MEGWRLAACDRLMKPARSWLCPAVLAGVFAAMPAVGRAAANRSDLDEQLQRLEVALQADDLDVRDGAVIPFNAVSLYCGGAIPSAIYANDEPYLRVMVPRLPQEPGPDRSVDFRLGADEAVVLIGLTPPPGRYFSYTPYLGWRQYPDARRQVFATIGDSVNNATVRTIGSTPFDAPVALIFTPDRGTDARVRAALRRIGFPTAAIDTVVFPASELRLGHEESADQVEIVLRNAIWDVPDAGDAYLRDPPLRVVRVTPHGATAPDPFAAPPLRIRGTGQSEMRLIHDLDRLRDGIVAAYPDLSHSDVMPRPECFEGYDLIQRGFRMCGDSRDAFYVTAGYLSDPGSTDLTLGDGEFLILYGVDHVASGKATYVNVNVYADPQARLTLGSIDDRQFPGTAGRYLGAGDPAAGRMYAWKVSRNCAGEANCLELASPCRDRLPLGDDTVLGVFTRIYLEPPTRIGPAMPEILYDRVLKFSPRPQPPVQQ